MPLALLALLAMALPLNVGGFGPREGVAAWAFGAAGLTASQGVATAVVYGALVLVSSLPGAVSAYAVDQPGTAGAGARPTGFHTHPAGPRRCRGRALPVAEPLGPADTYARQGRWVEHRKDAARFGTWRKEIECPTHCRSQRSGPR